MNKHAQSYREKVAAGRTSETTWQEIEAYAAEKQQEVADARRDYAERLVKCHAEFSEEERSIYSAIMGRFAAENFDEERAISDVAGEFDKPRDYVSDLFVKMEEKAKGAFPDV